MDGILLPRSWPWWLKTECGRGTRRSHGGSSPWTARTCIRAVIRTFRSPGHRPSLAKWRSYRASLPSPLSGARRDRPQLARLLDQVREQDVVVVDRLARSTRDLLEIAAEQLRKAGAGLRSLGEPWADTTSPAGCMMLTVFAGIAEFWRALIQEGTEAGRAAAKLGVESFSAVISPRRLPISCLSRKAAGRRERRSRPSSA